ncbi:MAG: alcohol dehydrogenase catalytic domain-containing protein [Anaerolineae bacterium]|nr:MAG: alcohol dehydrogenase catalytic domain-containing protein [Anaerolineae bacterium]
MKAALFYGGKDIRMEEVQNPIPGPGEVLVRVRAAGICGSDLHGYRDASRRWPGLSVPYMTGHELAGEVAALGPGVTGLAVGQRVGVEPRHLTGCGRCRWCRRGDYQLCLELGAPGGRPVYSTGFAEYSLEATEKCYPLPDDLAIEEAAILDVYAVGVHALHRLPVRPVDTVAVLGAGAIGLATAQVARAAGAGRVIAVGTRDKSLEVAKRLGCDEVLNATQSDVVEAVGAMTGGAGVEVVFEAVGGRASTLAQAIEIASRGGRVGIVGSFVEPQTLDPRLCMRKELTLRWVWSYGLWTGVPEYKIALDMLSDGRVQAAPLITHRFPLDRISEAFAAADDKRRSAAIKVLVLP